VKIAYFDCFAGASGDMILGALIDAGLPLDYLKNELLKLNLPPFQLAAEKTHKNHLSGTQVKIQIPPEHHHRTLKDIRALIRKSTLPDKVKETGISIFTRLAEVEGKIHNKSPESVHFHEVGAVDSIVDIMGAAIGFQRLEIEAVYASALPLGSGSIECAHGVLPGPAPATLELLRNIPVVPSDIKQELVTPTGAAILSTLSSAFGPVPEMIIENIGYGLGMKDLRIPNLLRVIIGNQSPEIHGDTVQLIETNIDDMNPQFYDHIMERLFEAGALDVFMTQVIMKKNRPGIVLSILAIPERVNDLSDILFRETTTLGVRISEVKKRKVLDRRIISVSTRWGQGHAKIRILASGEKSAEPEYRDCKALAQKNQVPIQLIYQALKKEAEQQISREVNPSSSLGEESL
jgi:uncharacterized protein (TIGR00299 family) protein